MGIFSSQNQDEIRPAQTKQGKTLIGPLTEVKANLSGKENIVIAGVFSGILKIEGDLVILDTARVEGEFEATNIFIQGQIQGKISATEKVEMSSTARVTADIVTAIIAVQPGAVLNGHCQTIKVSDNQMDNYLTNHQNQCMKTAIFILTFIHHFLAS